MAAISIMTNGFSKKIKKCLHWEKFKHGCCRKARKRTSFSKCNCKLFKLDSINEINTIHLKSLLQIKIKSCRLFSGCFAAGAPSWARRQAAAGAEPQSDWRCQKRRKGWRCTCGHCYGCSRKLTEVCGKPTSEGCFFDFLDFCFGSTKQSAAIRSSEEVFHLKFNGQNFGGVFGVNLGPSSNSWDFQLGYVLMWKRCFWSEFRALKQHHGTFNVFFSFVYLSIQVCDGSEAAFGFLRGLLHGPRWVPALVGSKWVGWWVACLQMKSQ